MNSSLSTSPAAHYDVIVAGAGPVGLLLSIDLGRRGVKTLLLEQSPTTAPFPKMDRCNARTMEIFRRAGWADDIRALGYPADNPMDVFLIQRLSDEAIVSLRYPSVAQMREKIAACTDGSLPLEPYQLVSQNYVEPYLKGVAEKTQNVTVRYGCGLVDFEQDSEGVTVFAEGDVVFRGKYLVGCDGGRSTVRKKLGVELSGQGGMRQLTQVIFTAEGLYDKIVCGKGRHYCFAGGRGSFTAQGNRKEYTFHSGLPVDADFEKEIADRIGFPCDIKITTKVPWKHNLLVADKFRLGRVLIAGDSAHQVIPNGGLGMNTGVGDAFDLSWKLAGTIHGWGGSKLLDSYELERRPVGQRNVEASGWATGSVLKWWPHDTPKIFEDSPEGHVARRRLSEAFHEYHPRMYGMIGVELGYSYAWSQIIADEPDNVPEWQFSDYTPHARPGVRIPHMWLKDGRALQDALGQNYTLLDLRGTAESEALESAFKALGAPLDVTRLDEPHLCEVYESGLLLLRPDLHIAWRGEKLPQDAHGLARLVTGN